MVLIGQGFRGLCSMWNMRHEFMASCCGRGKAPARCCGQVTSHSCCLPHKVQVKLSSEWIEAGCQRRSREVAGGQRGRPLLAAAKLRPGRLAEDTKTSRMPVSIISIAHLKPLNQTPP